MLAEVHPLPMREVSSQVYNLEAGEVITSNAFMIQGYSRIVGAIEFVAGGGPGAIVFTIFQGYQNVAAGGFMEWTHNTDILNIVTNSNTPFNYAVLLKGTYFVINNTSGQPADLFLSIYLRNE